jgi:hypothetical protein
MVFLKYIPYEKDPEEEPIINVDNRPLANMTPYNNDISAGPPLNEASNSPITLPLCLG